MSQNATISAEVNGPHITQYGPLDQAAHDKVEAIATKMVGMRSEDHPADGDAVILHGHNRSGPVTYNGGHLEVDRYGDDGSLSFCTQPMAPYINRDGACEASGGYWGRVNTEDLKLVGTREKLFWTFRKGACAGGGIRFTVTVNVWEYTDTDTIY